MKKNTKKNTNVMSIWRRIGDVEHELCVVVTRSISWGHRERYRGRYRGSNDKGCLTCDICEHKTDLSGSWVGEIKLVEGTLSVDFSSDTSVVENKYHEDHSDPPYTHTHTGEMLTLLFHVDL
jgi:hypothetical protein